MTPTLMSKKRQARKYNRNLRDMAAVGIALDAALKQAQELRVVGECNVYDQPTRH